MVQCIEVKGISAEGVGTVQGMAASVHQPMGSRECEVEIINMMGVIYFVGRERREGQ